MNKAELIDALESKLGSKKAASDALEALLDTVIREVAKGGSVGITGFGTFERADRRARTGRNPKTGETVRIKKTRVPKFRPGTNFKEIVSGAKKVSKGTSAAARASAGSSLAAVAAPAKAAAKKSSAKKAAPVRKATTKSAAKTTAARATRPTTKAAPARTAARKTTTAAKKTTARKAATKR